MSRRLVVLSVLLALAAPFAHAADVAEPESLRAALARIGARQAALTELFARFAQPGDSVESSDGVSAPAGTMEVVVARLGTDGKPVIGCVDNSESARRFFETSLENLQQRRAQDQ
ncbi:MAG: hypothetical protein M3Q69_01525 [Acidobacteriota bacterium]|nr:hypothetical protein [Acidobacteriota bacterium]